MYGTWDWHEISKSPDLMCHTFFNLMADTHAGSWPGVPFLHLCWSRERKERAAWCHVLACFQSWSPHTFQWRWSNVCARVICIARFICDINHSIETFLHILKNKQLCLISYVAGVMCGGSDSDFCENADTVYKEVPIYICILLKGMHTDLAPFGSAGLLLVNLLKMLQNSSLDIFLPPVFKLWPSLFIFFSSPESLYFSILSTSQRHIFLCYYPFFHNMSSLYYRSQHIIHFLTTF